MDFSFLFFSLFFSFFISFFLFVGFLFLDEQMKLGRSNKNGMRVTTVTMRRHGLAHTGNITHRTRTRLAIASWCAHTIQQ
jgi:hypothetical protein